MIEEMSLTDLSARPEYNFAVKVTDAYKKYGGQNFALRGLNMSVKQGTIYGLLGPSGCGKTTLLGCLIGQRELDGGKIAMQINRTSQIGYMPQELALFEEFSIKEHLMFYGYISEMKKLDILRSSQKLMKFLDLPNIDSLVSSLSGGQKRRVSLCIALLHDPILLILDEPTVGVDVILSESIWDKLVEMSENEKKTVIVTTHYIQEARRSHTIGLMREGKILAEDDPCSLMRFHGGQSLEDVFLKLCRQTLTLNDYGDEENEDSKGTQSIQLVKTPYTLFKRTNFEMNRVLAYSMKSFVWMRRNIPLVLFTLLLPIVQCTLISVTVGDDPFNIGLAFVNDENKTDEFQNSTSFVYEGTRCDDNSTFSAEYLNFLRKERLILKPFSDLDTAQEAAKRNKVWGVLYFYPDYTHSVIERLNLANKASDLAVNHSEVVVWLDQSNEVIAQLLKRQILEAAVALLESVSQRCNFTNMPPSPHSVEKIEAIFGNNNPNFRQFMTPANAVLFAFYLPMMFTLGAMLMEKTSGLLERGLAAGLTLLEVAIGHVVLQFVILVAQTALMMVVLYCAFDNPIQGSITWCVIFLLFVGVCGMFYGFFIAALCDSFTTASCLAIGSYFPLFMLSGAIWPLEGMHYVMRYISMFLPVTSSVETYRSISARSWTITHPKVYGSLISLSIWTTVFAVMTAVMVKFRGVK
ncbi:ATP-Hypothetical protein cassette sub-family A ABC1 member [Nesidiocoris tenuis]|uniref:ABC transporter domain-containing protein n=1 Tax=Nesidiocoris tenuis TaxID=355587 RepID=A0ABN7B2X6_9HEMI|nr:ATP-Hypothetical protein cassette sub-family A ABC1 member [Nesidiocoris tenuis]